MKSYDLLQKGMNAFLSRKEKEDVIEFLSNQKRKTISEEKLSLAMLGLSDANIEPLKKIINDYNEINKSIKKEYTFNILADLASIMYFQNLIPESLNDEFMRLVVSADNSHLATFLKGIYFAERNDENPDQMLHKDSDNNFYRVINGQQIYEKRLYEDIAKVKNGQYIVYAIINARLGDQTSTIYHFVTDKGIIDISLDSTIMQYINKCMEFNKNSMIEIKDNILTNEELLKCFEIKQHLK